MPKVIADQAGTNAAKTAYEEKMRAILGWEDPDDGENYGMRGNYSMYLPLLEETFREYEKAFPQSSTLQGFRFQVAQGYWVKKNWAKTRELLNEIIEKDGGANSFYKDLAERRLKKVEH